jgi:hypothetical protein
MEKYLDKKARYEIAHAIVDEKVNKSLDLLIKLADYYEEVDRDETSKVFQFEHDSFGKYRASAWTPAWGTCMNWPGPSSHWSTTCRNYTDGLLTYPLSGYLKTTNYQNQRSSQPRIITLDYAKVPHNCC